MRRIARRGTTTISALAQDMGADRTTLTRNLTQLEKKRLITIGPAQDRRVKVVELAPKGKVALERSVSYWEKAQGQALKTLGEKRWARMMGDLSAIAALVRPE